MTAIGMALPQGVKNRNKRAGVKQATASLPSGKPQPFEVLVETSSPLVCLTQMNVYSF